MEQNRTLIRELTNQGETSMKSLRLFLLFIMFVFLSSLYAGTTGKIAGQIRDAQTGEPLPGANVTIADTYLGAATDLNGEYVILNIPGGIYTLKMSMMGYKDHIVENVRVSIDLTTRINSDMELTVLDAGETVVVTAERPLVQMDMTASLHSVSADEIDILPQQSVGGLLSLQAGVINYGGIHIRGGRSGEVAYWVDGVSTTDVFNGSQGITVENSSIQELQVVSGTFNAEYGQAMSGIVNIITKEGGSKYSGQVKAYMGDYISTSDIYDVLNKVKVTELADGSLQEYSESENPLKKLNASYDVEASLHGPVPFTKNKLTFFMNGRYFSDEGFFYGRNWFTPQSLPGDSSLMSLNPYERTSLQGKIAYRPWVNTKISYNVFWNDWNRERSNSRDLKYAPTAIPRSFGNSSTHILSLNQVISPKSFFEIRVNRFTNESRQYLYEDPLKTPHWMATVTDDSGSVSTIDLRTDAGQAALKDAQLNQWAYEYFVDPNDAEGYMHSDSLTTPAQYSFLRGGTDLNHFYRKTSYWVGKFDMVSQITAKQQIKFGAEARLTEIKLDNFTLQPKVDANGLTVEPFAPAIPDISTIYHSKYTRRPREISAYVQDKMEFFDLIVNVGLRFDYFDANSVVPADPTDPNIYNPYRPENKYRNWVEPSSGLSYTERQEYEKTFQEYTPDERRAFMHKKNDPKTQISPRLGIAYPITDKGVIHFSYGHFFQIPEFSYLYSVPDFKLSSGNRNIFGNANLDAQKTVQYELGLSQQFGRDIGLDVTVFYRDIRDWVGTSPVQQTALSSVAYVTYKNEDYSNVRGFNIRLEKRLYNYFGARIDYAYQVAEGTYSNPTDAFYSGLNNEEPRLNMIPLNWDQRHTLSAQLMSRFLDWTVTLVGRYNTGTPYTPTFAIAEAVGSTNYTGLTQNSARKPNIHGYDLYITRTFQIQKMDLTLFAYVYNLFDQREEVNVYVDTGTASYTTNPRLESVAPALKRIGTVEDLYTRPDFYVAPRQVQIGLSLGF
ncbi:TonB-dependent receptor [candidate division KSB1 bacterium]|nr:TonB-dependent receptor [candidate division KSB1 bacterium]